MKKKSQKEKVFEWLSRYGTISEHEARTELNIYRLSDVIFKLRRKPIDTGYYIKTAKDNVSRPDGSKINLSRYILKKKIWCHHLDKYGYVEVDIIVDVLKISRRWIYDFAGKSRGLYAPNHLYFKYGIRKIGMSILKEDAEALEKIVSEGRAMVASLNGPGILTIGWSPDAEERRLWPKIYGSKD